MPGSLVLGLEQFCIVISFSSSQVSLLWITTFGSTLTVMLQLGDNFLGFHSFSPVSSLFVVVKTCFANHNWLLYRGEHRFIT
jgi:hypothetical protein